MTRSIIYSSPFVPVEWIAAHGMRPVRLIPRSAMRTPTVGRSFGVCPFARAFAHEVLSLEEEAAVVFATTCDQMRRAADLVEANSELPVFLMNVPATWRTVSAQRLYLDELKRLGRFLVRLGGKPPSGDELASIMLHYDSARLGIHESRTSLPPREYAEALADMNPNRQLSNFSDDRHSARRVPLAIVGGPLLKDDFYIYDLV